MASNVEIKSVSKIFPHPVAPVRAVDDVSLSIAAGEFFTLLGPSGCGKTTLLRLIAGLDLPDAGAILLDGEDIAPLPAHRRPVNTVFQSYALFPHMSVAENLGFGLRMQKKPSAEIETSVKDALSLVRLEGMEDRKPAQLSGGQQQRVALARALVNRPRILLLDESLSALDYKLRKEMQVELKRLQRETGITFVFVTHDQDEALSMSDRIAVMDSGKVAQTGTPQEVYEKPATRFVAGFVGTCNFIRAASLGLSEDAEIGFRPEDASFVTEGAQAKGRLAHIHYRGAVTHYMIELESGESVTLSEDDPLALQPGDSVGISVPAERLIRCAA